MTSYRQLFKTVLLASLCLLSGFTYAQEETVKPTPAEPARSERSDTDTDAAVPEANQDGFIPTEKINVDTEISFPIDI